MNSTQGVIEVCNLLFSELKEVVDARDYYKFQVDTNGRELTVEAGTLYSWRLHDCIIDYIKRPGMIQDLLHRPRLFRPLTQASTRKYAAMDKEAFAKVLFDVCTKNGTKVIPDTGESPDFWERCLYAAYIYTVLTDYLERQNATFLPVPFNKGMQALALINTGIADIDEHTKQGKITVGDVVFSVRAAKVSTAAQMLNVFFLHEARRTQAASLAIPLLDYAAIKKRSTSKQALQKLKAEVIEQMEELKPLGYVCQERIGGKLKTTGRVDINGGTATVANGVIYWNYNQDLFNQLMLYAPTDTPKELFAVDPRTSAFYFGLYIAQNRRLNEGKPGREKIPMRTLIEKSPNLPTYAEVMKGNRNVSDRIIKKAFADLDALETLYYDFYTAAGEKVENPDALDYQTFINGYILVDYSDYPEHPDRVQKKRERQKKTQAAKEKAQIAAAAKAAAEKG